MVSEALVCCALLIQEKDSLCKQIKNGTLNRAYVLVIVQKHLFEKLLEVSEVSPGSHSGECCGRLGKHARAVAGRCTSSSQELASSYLHT